MEPLVLSFSLVLARVTAFLAVLPILGGANAPRTVKVGLSVALALLYLSLLGVGPAQAVLHGGELSWLTFGLAIGREAILGAFLGYVMGLVLLPARIVGDYLGQEMGLTLGQLSDPLSGPPSAVLSQFFELLAGVLFLGLDGHHLFFAALHGLFLRLPVGAATPLPVAGLVAGLDSAQQAGLLLAAPVGAVLFLTSLALALMTRAAPQLNVFSLSFAIRVGAGLGAVLLLFPDFLRALVGVLGRMGGLLERLV